MNKHSAELVMDASPESPMVNACLVIKNWEQAEPSVEMETSTLPVNIKISHQKGGAK